MTELVLVRHGETVWHAENRYAGRSDVPLTPRGQEQAGALARWATGAGLDAVLTSPLCRARETAGPACAALVS
jgi:broad specificity phosphatase PhoE